MNQHGLSDLESTESRRRDFSPLRWRLLGVANVDRRDIVNHGDSGRYGAIGVFVLAFGLYAAAGWFVFLATAGALDAFGDGGKGIAATAAIAAVVALLVVTFDRSIIGQTDAALHELTPSQGDGQDEADRERRVLLHPVGRLSKKLLVVRVFIAVAIAAFASQAIEVGLFHNEIVTQQAQQKQTRLAGDLRALEAERQRGAADALVLKREAQQAWEVADARVNVNEQWRARSGEGCGPVCRDLRAAVRTADAERTRLAEGRQADLAAFLAAKQKIQADQAQLRTSPADAVASESGGLADTQALIAYIGANPGAAAVYVLLLVLLLTVDLFALALKFASRNTEYERRQALRQRRRTLEVAERAYLAMEAARAEVRARAERERREHQRDLDEARTAALADEAMHAALRDAHRRVSNDSQVRSEAKRQSRRQVLDRLDERRDDPAWLPPAPDDDPRFADAADVPPRIGRR